MKDLEAPESEGRAATSSALSRGLNLLAAFVEPPVWLGNSDLVQRTGLPAPTVARLLKSLSALGLLTYSESRRQFRLASGVLALSGGARDASSVGEEIRPRLQDIADRHHVHVSLAVQDGTDALHIEACHSATTLMTLRLEVGSRIPLAGTATGHAILAAMTEGERRSVFEQLRARHSKNWPAISAAIAEAEQEVAATGYTRSVGSWHTDINGVAVPFRPRGASAAMSIACGAPSRHLPAEKLSEIGRELSALASTFSRPDPHHAKAD